MRDKKVKRSNVVKSIKKNNRPTIINSTPNFKKVIKKGGCCGRSNF